MSLQGGSTTGLQKVAGNASSAPSGISINATTNTMSIGTGAGAAGVNNTYVGNDAAAGTSGGGGNSVLGYGAAPGIATSENVVVGSFAGASCTTGGRNVVVGSRADVSAAGDASSVVIGYNARSGGPGSVVLGAGAVGGAGVGAINIAGRITASNGADGTYTLRLGGSEHVRLSPTVRVLLDAPLVLTAGDAGRTPWWRMATAAGLSDPSSYRLEFRSRNNTVVGFDDEFAPGVLNFTGQHRCALATGDGDGVDGDGDGALRVGCVLVATGRYRNLDGSEAPGIDEAVPVVEVSRAQEDPRVFGVLAGFEGDRDAPRGRRAFRLGHLRFAIPCAPGEARAARVAVNSVGEGGVLVCDWTGPVRNGDLLTSSPVAGLAMRQGDRVLASHTLAKATCDCTFDKPLEARRHEGRAVRVGFVGCSYRC